MPERPDPPTHERPPSGSPDPAARNRRPAALDAALLHDELSVLHQRVTRFTAAHNALARVLDNEVRPGLATLASLKAQLDELAHSLNTPVPRPVHWPALSAAQAGAQWPILADWIAEVLVPGYELTRAQLPDCWALHPPAVIELSWLRSAHIHAYQPSAPPALAAEWHCRWRDAVLDRLAVIIPTTLCRPGEHLRNQPTSNPPTTTNTAPRRLEPWDTGHAHHSPPLGAAGQRAERHHWQDFYQQAVHADLARRRRAHDQRQPDTA